MKTKEEEGQLRQDFLEEIFTTTDKNELADRCVEVANSHSQEVAVAFAEWIRDNGYGWTNDPLLGEWWYKEDTQNTYTTSELYEKFKEENK